MFALLQLHTAFAKVEIHTDNPFDIENLKAKKAEGFAVSTNLAALENEYSEVKFAMVPLKRTMKFIEQKQNVCVLNRIKTRERAELYLFSKPINLFFNRRLYQSADLDPLSTKAIDLIELFKQYPKRRIIISNQLSYGDELDAVIKQLPKKNIVVRNSGNQARGVLEMFYQKRAEYALIAPQELDGDDLEINSQSYELKGIPPYVVGHLMCANTPKTQALIKRVNKKITDLIQYQELYNIHLDYLSQAQHIYFKQYYQKVFKSE